MMNKELQRKIEQLYGAKNSRDLLFQDNVVSESSGYAKKMNLSNVRGSVRLIREKIVTPDEVQRMRSDVAHYRFK